MLFWAACSGELKGDRSSQSRALVQYAWTNSKYQRLLGFPLLIRDLVRRNAASVAGPNAADVGEGEEARNAHQSHTGAVQVHLSQVHVFQELQT